MPFRRLRAALLVPPLYASIRRNAIPESRYFSLQVLSLLGSKVRCGREGSVRAAQAVKILRPGYQTTDRDVSLPAGGRVRAGPGPSSPVAAGPVTHIARSPGVRHKRGNGRRGRPHGKRAKLADDPLYPLQLI